MAYDGFQRSASPYEQLNNHGNQAPPNDFRPSSYPTSYSGQYASNQVNMPQPQMPPTAPFSAQSVYSEPPPQQHSWYQQPSTGTINEAVSSAFHKADTPAYLSPEILSQITATVIQQLRATGLDNSQGQHPPGPQQYSSQLPSGPPPPPPPPPQQQQWAPSAAPQFNYNEYESPPAVPPKTSSPQSNVASESAEYQQYPPPGTYPHSPRLSSRPSPVPPLERRESPFSQASDQAQKMEARPRPPSRNETITEMTTLERVWGRLFEDGKPTAKLGQLLRGIAVHLIEDYPPGNTIVVVPEKLQKFYEDTAVPSDQYPWQDIFDDRTSSISRLFREVEAEHHLVQAKLNERPDIPGLTPQGFERWATLMIQAHPDKEYERLQKAVLNMPISNPDDRRERFPKEIPRRLFPEAPDLAVRDELDRFITKHCGVDLPPVTEEELKKVAVHRHKASTSSAASAADSTQSLNERDRHHPRASSSAIVDDENEEILSQPIERERKPYTAQPGGGKVYGEEHGTSSHRRTESMASSTRPNEDSTLPTASHKAYDLHSHDPFYPRTGSRGSLRPISAHIRPRSSSRGQAMNDYRHSESDLPSHSHSHSQSHSHSTSPRYSGSDYYSTASTLPGELADDARRYREAEDQRLYDSLWEREKEREKGKYHDHDHLPHRGSRADEEEYYRGLLGGQGGGPVGGNGGYDYKTYTYK